MNLKASDITNKNKGINMSDTELTFPPPDVFLKYNIYCDVVAPNDPNKPMNPLYYALNILRAVAKGLRSDDEHFYNAFLYVAWSCLKYKRGLDTYTEEQQEVMDNLMQSEVITQEMMDCFLLDDNGRFTFQGSEQEY